MDRPKRGQLHISKPQSRDRTSHLQNEKRNEQTITQNKKLVLPILLQHQYTNILELKFH